MQKRHFEEKQARKKENGREKWKGDKKGTNK
jgi:hypothetical protein